MEKDIITFIATQGAFATLFTWLLIDTRKDSKLREMKYIETIDKLSDKFNIVQRIEEKVDELTKELKEDRK